MKKFMKYISYFTVLAICLNGCKQNSIDKELTYRLTSYKFLQLLNEGKIDSAKRILAYIPNDSTGLIDEMRLIKRFLNESKTIPDYKTFVLDSTNVEFTKERRYEIKLYKDGQTIDPDNFIGNVRIEFKEGLPENICGIMAVAKPSKL